VLIGRLSTVLLMIFAGLLSKYLNDAEEVFQLLLQIGAGTGLLFILRWFWDRINPYSEIAAMLISFIIALVFFINSKLSSPIFIIEGHWQLILGVFITTISWIIVTLVTQPTNKKKLNKFNNLIFDTESKFHNINYKILAFLLGVIGTYCFLFSTGYFIYGKIILASSLGLLSLICGIVLIKIWNKIS
jgi:Na+/proline symporter